MAQQVVKETKTPTPDLNGTVLAIAGAGLVKNTDLLSQLLHSHFMQQDPLLRATSAYATSSIMQVANLHGNEFNDAYQNNAMVRAVAAQALAYAVSAIGENQSISIPDDKSEFIPNALTVGQICGNYGNPDYTKVLLCAENRSVWGPHQTEAGLVAELFQTTVLPQQVHSALLRHEAILPLMAQEEHGYEAGRGFIKRIFGSHQRDLAIYSQSDEGERSKIAIVKALAQADPRYLAEATYLLLEKLQWHEAFPGDLDLAQSTLGGIYGEIIKLWVAMKSEQIIIDHTDRFLRGDILNLIHEYEARSVEGQTLKADLLTLLSEKLSWFKPDPKA